MEGESGAQRARDIVIGAVLATLLLAVGLGVGYVLSNRAGAPEVLVLPTRMASPTTAALVPTLTPTVEGESSPAVNVQTTLVVSPTVTIGESATPMPTLPPDEIVRFRTQVDGILAYVGPSDQVGVMGALALDQEVLVAGRSADGVWWLVCCVETAPAWVKLENGNMLLISGDIGTVEVVQ
jgi:hypothetical protein